MLIKALRLVLGNTIVAADYLTRPRKLRRDAASQQRVDAAAAKLALYQFRACPFCVKTRRTLHRLNVPVALRDAKNDPVHRQALQEGGGRVKVPCLRIEEAGKVTWMYESKAIIAYLDERFASA